MPDKFPVLLGGHQCFVEFRRGEWYVLTWDGQVVDTLKQLEIELVLAAWQAGRNSMLP